MSDPGPVLLVADAGDDAGLGHIARSSALAAALRERAIATTCAGFEGPSTFERSGVVWEPASAERIAALAQAAPLVVLDSYRLSADAVASIAAATSLAVMLDFGDPPPGARLAIEPSATGGDRPGRLAGLAYACLGAEFRDPPARDPSQPVKTILVSTGGGDPGGLARDLAAAARRAVPDARVLLVRGPQAQPQAPEGVELCGPFDSLAPVLADADVVVCGAGGTLVETCASGVPAIGVVLADNQRPLAKALARAGAVGLIDDAAEAAEAIASLAANPERRATLSAAARRAVDGRGAERVAAELERLLSR